MRSPKEKNVELKYMYTRAFSKTSKN